MVTIIKGIVVACWKDELKVVIHSSWTTLDDVMAIASSEEEKIVVWTIFDILMIILGIMHLLIFWIDFKSTFMPLLKEKMMTCWVLK